MTKKELREIETLKRQCVLGLGDALNDLEFIIRHYDEFTVAGLVEIAKNADKQIREVMERLGAPDSEQAIVQTVRASMGRAHRADGRDIASEDWLNPRRSDLHK